MSPTVVGATGRIGREVVRGLLAEGEPVLAVVRDAARARDLLGERDGLTIQAIDLADRRGLAAALAPAETVFVALASVGEAAAVTRQVLMVAADAPRLRRLVRLSVLNAGPRSLGINQRAHWSIDRTAELLGLPYATLRPAIFASVVHAAATEIGASGIWTGIADRGAVPLIDPRDVAACAVRVILDPSSGHDHHDLTGPELWTWPRVAALLSRELGGPLRFEAVSEGELLDRLLASGVPPGEAQLLVTRDLALRAGENERRTDAVRHLTGHAPGDLADYVREHRALGAFTTGGRARDRR